MRSTAARLSAILPFISLAASQCTLSNLVVRLPPSLDPGSVSLTSSSFVAPASTWFSGNWHVTYSSSPTYQQIQNMQYDSYPVLPTCEASDPADCVPGTFPGQLVDLTSFTLPGETDGKIHTAFGYDTPRRSDNTTLGPEWDAVYDFRGAGEFNYTANSWELLSWGFDETGAGYMAIYETPVEGPSPQPATLDIESRNEKGPSAMFLLGLKTQLKALGNKDLSALVDGLGTVANTGARDGMGPVVCGKSCQANTGIGSGKGRNGM